MLSINKNPEMTDQTPDSILKGTSYRHLVLFAVVILIICLLPFAGYLSPHYTILALSAIATALAVLIFIKGTWFGLQCILYVLPFAQLAAIPVWMQGGQRVYLRLLDVVVFATVAIWFFVKLKHQKWGRPDSVETSMFGLFLILLLSLIVNSRFLTIPQFLYSLMYPVRWIMYGSLFFIVRDLVSKSEDRRMVMKNLLIGAGLSVAIVGLVQIIIFPDIYVVKASNYDLGILRMVDLDPHAGRLLSTLLDPNYAGGFLALILIMVVSQIAFLEPPNKVSVGTKKQLRSFVIFGVLLIAFILTYSRGSQLSLIAGMITVTIGAGLQGRTELRRAVSILLIVIIFLVTNPRVLSRYVIFEKHAEKRIENHIENRFEPSTQARLKTWYQGFRIFWEHPILGVGYNAYKWYSKNFSVAGSGAQNSFITLLATTGLIGVMMLLWFAIQIFSAVWSARSSLLSNETWLIWASYGALASLAIHAMFIESLFYPPVLVYIGTLLGLLPKIERSTALNISA